MWVEKNAYTYIFIEASNYEFPQLYDHFFMYLFRGQQDKIQENKCKSLRLVERRFCIYLANTAYLSAEFQKNKTGCNEW